jgi:hypothetical protein
MRAAPPSLAMFALSMQQCASASPCSRGGPCLRVEVRAGVNTSVRRPASVGALAQGRDRWPDWWTHACGRAASGGAARYWAWVHSCHVEGGAGTASRGPAPTRAYGGARRAGSRSGARERGRHRHVLKQPRVALFD